MKNEPKDPRLAGVLETIDLTGECADRYILAVAVGRGFVVFHNGKHILSWYGQKWLQEQRSDACGASER